MSRYGVEFYRDAARRLAVDGEGPDLGFVESGYLLLCDEEGIPTLKANYELQREHGASVELLTPDNLAQRYPELNLDDIAAATFGNRNEGWIDPMSLLNGFRRKARSLGVEYVQD